MLGVGIDGGVGDGGAGDGGAGDGGAGVGVVLEDVLLELAALDSGGVVELGGALGMEGKVGIAILGAAADGVDDDGVVVDSGSVGSDTSPGVQYPGSAAQVVPSGQPEKLSVLYFASTDDRPVIQGCVQPLAHFTSLGKQHVTSSPSVLQTKPGSQTDAPQHIEPDLAQSFPPHVCASLGQQAKPRSGLQTALV